VKLLIWDFDGTLGYRDGGAWSATLDEIARSESPGSEVTIEQIIENLQSGFPWHTPSWVHTDIESADAWWAALEPVLVRTFERLGFGPSQSLTLANQVRPVYTDTGRWKLYDDTLRVLRHLAGQGWTHVLLTNHVPELRAIVSHLKLDRLLTAIFNSAETGYEKGHPQAFRQVLDRFPEATDVWVIGDSMSADIRGAAAAGIPAILVRKSHGDALHYCRTLTGIGAIVDAPRSS